MENPGGGELFLFVCPDARFLLPSTKKMINPQGVMVMYCSISPVTIPLGYPPGVGNCLKHVGGNYS